MLFRLDNIQCSYDSEKLVLEIPKLELESNKIYFVLGSSGIGKSTFLELLGLMTNISVSSNNPQIAYQNKNNNLLDLWTDDDKIADFRKKNYGFLFQNSYLMPNFTNRQNLYFGPYLNDESGSELDDKIAKYCERVGLPLNMLDRYPQQLSGGQRQRVSFLIAMLSEHKVIFGDEPTGNLDKKNAHELLKCLSDEIKSKGKTAFLVSHDIDLAKSFGDEIIIIKANNGIGLISEENIAKRKSPGKWLINSTEMDEDSLTAYLENSI